MSYGFVPIRNSLDYLAAIVDGEGTIERHQYCAKKPKPVWAKDFQKTCYLKVRELNKSGVKKVGMEVNESWSIEKYCPSQKSILSY